MFVYTDFYGYWKLIFVCVCVSHHGHREEGFSPIPNFRLRILILKFIIIIMVKTNYLIWQLYCIYPLKLHQKRPQITKDPNVFWGSISLDSPRFAHPSWKKLACLLLSSLYAHNHSFCHFMLSYFISIHM